MKTLYIDINEEITTIVGKIQNTKSHNIILVVPKRAQLFQSLINLKILKKKAEQAEKKLEVFTTDKKGKQFCVKQGIDLYEGSLSGIDASKSIHVEGVFTDTTVSDSKEKKVSLTELIGEEQKKHKLEKIISKPQSKKQKQERKKWSRLFLQSTLRKRTTFAFLTASVVVLFFVSYIALPSATIYITPSSNVVEKTVNITLADREKRKDLLQQSDRNIIPSFTIESVFEQNLNYNVQGKVFTGANATCELTIMNDRSTPWQLIEQTRFQSAEGIVFRIAEAVTVPASNFEIVKDENGNSSGEKIPGKLSVRVTADETYGQNDIAGAKGNLPAKTHFILPALTQENQDVIYAINQKPCSNGRTSYYSIVTEDDIEAAEAKMNQQLSKGAKEFLQDFVEANNLKNRVNLVLFDDPQVIQEEVLEITMEPDLLNKKKNSFTVHGKMSVRGIAYNKEDYFTILDTELLKKVHPEKRLASIDRNSVTYTLVYSDSDINDLSKVKLSVTVKGVEEYNFDPNSEEGADIINKILTFVPQKKMQEAALFISNLEQIQRANISVWPFWQKTIPGLKSSIKIKVN
jgi:hypothetical protein